MEVHHIVPEAEGGSNDAENAIALCFDCHTDAGHYNADHPRGTKFSRTELLSARENWHQAVELDRIPVAPEVEIHSRYLLCKSFEVIREIARGELRSIPVEKPALVTTPPLDFITSIVARYPDDYRGDEVPGDEFGTAEDYSLEHPGAFFCEPSWDSVLPYFEAVRIPDHDEVEGRISSDDPLTGLLLRSGVPTKEVIVALAYREMCGGDRFQEVYRLRPLWLLLLAVTNHGERPLTLSSLEGLFDAPKDAGFRSLWERGLESSIYRLPAAGLDPGATALIPVATLLGPLWLDLAEPFRTEISYVAEGQSQTLEHADMRSAASATSLIGPAIWPSVIKSVEGEHPVHDFDPGNTYRLSREWLMGSCPHIFLRNERSGELVYFQEIFSHRMNQEQHHEFVVPNGVNEIVIAELEDETTRINFLSLDGRLVYSNLTMFKSDALLIPAASGQVFRIAGSYSVRGVPRIQPWRKNQVIVEFLRIGRQNKLTAR